MEPARSADAAIFAGYLEATGQSYLLLDDSTPQQAHLRFTGRFQGMAVVWDCRFVTLQSEMQRRGLPRMRNFIDIGAAGKQGVPIRVGLNLERIEQPDILKMMVMVRNYNRLRRGSQTFGMEFPPMST